MKTFKEENKALCVLQNVLDLPVTIGKEITD